MGTRTVGLRRAVITAWGIALGLAIALPGRAATFVVTNVNDSGAGSLRQAVADANAVVGADVITFSLANCPCTIFPVSTLLVSDELSVNGPGATTLALDGGGGGAGAQVRRGAAGRLGPHHPQREGHERRRHLRRRSADAHEGHDES